MKALVLLPILLLCTIFAMDYDKYQDNNIIIEIENGKIISTSEDIYIKPESKSKCHIIIPAIIITSIIAAGTALTIHFTQN